MGMSWWLALVAIAAFPPGDDKRGQSATEASRPASTLCSSGAFNEMIHLRIIPPGVRYRVHPSPREIIERGAKNALRRAVFSELVQSRLCDPNLPDADASRGEFLPRIVIFVEGEEDHQLVSLEYPSWEDAPPPVRAHIDGRTVLVPAATIRFLLDHSRTMPPDGE